MVCSIFNGKEQAVTAHTQHAVVCHDRLWLVPDLRFSRRWRFRSRSLGCDTV